MLSNCFPPTEMWNKVIKVGLLVFFHSSRLYEIILEKKGEAPVIVYHPERKFQTTPVKDIPPVKDISRSKYGNNPDLNLLNKEERKLCLSAIRSRRHISNLKQRISSTSES